MVPDPQTSAQETISFMKERADPDRVATLQRYFKDPIQAYGVEYAAIKEWRKGFVAKVKDVWTIEDAVTFCETMLKDPHLEVRGTGYQIVSEFVASAGPGLLGDIRRWLEESCGNWGLVDNLVPSVLSPLLRNHPELVPEVKSWTSSPVLWVRRGAAVAFVSLVDEENFMTAAYEVATSLLDDKEDLIHKAVGWMLREAGKIDRDRLEAYLLEKGSQTPRTTLRYAIEKFPKEDRKRLMAATR